LRFNKTIVCLAILACTPAGAATIDNVAVPAGVASTKLADTVPMRIILSLKLRDPEGAAAFAAAVSDPRSPAYGHYMSATEFGLRFGPAADTYEYLRSWALMNGLSVGPRTPSRTTVSVAGNAGQFARLFSTSFSSFHTPTHGDGVSMLTVPQVPVELATRIEGVVGLSSAGHYFPLAHILAGPRANVGTGVNGSGYAPSDIRTAYNIAGQTTSKKTEVLAIFEQGGLRVSQLTKYETQYNLPKVKLTQKSVNGAPTGLSDSGVELEALLDVDAALGVNTALKSVIVYEDGADTFQVALLDSLQQVATDGIAKVLSISYGQDEVMQGTSAVQAENTALVQLASQGITVFASSGDQGAAGRTGTGLNAPDPGSQPYLTSVGGTALQTVSAGGAWQSEVVWDNSASSATGGGASSIWSIPSWQVVNGVSVAAKNHGSATKRNVPDVAAVADPNTGYSVYDSTYGGFIAIGGTSLSAPLWAGITTIINSDRVAAGLARVGFFNPKLYQLGVVGTGFHDVTSGHNGSPGFKAGRGYDNTTGFGSVDLGTFLPIVLQ